MEQTIRVKKGSVPISISRYDLDVCLMPVGKKFVELDDHERESILYYLGVDTRVEIEEFECLHRAKFSPNNEPVEGVLLTGVERVDEAWFLSGKATLENRINRNSCSGFNTELRMMSAQSNFTADIVNHIQKVSSANQG